MDTTGSLPLPGIRRAGAVPPQARVTRAGRWRWRIVIEDGLLECGPGFGGVVLGWSSWGSRERAEAKAARLLARHMEPRPEGDEFVVR